MQKLGYNEIDEESPLPDVPCIIIYPKERDEITNPFSENKLQDLCRTPTDEELAESMNMTTAQLSKLMANTAGMITLSFEELLYEDNLDENISASSETADAKMYEREKKQVIADAVATLPEKEKQVVTMYYYERLKYSEIAKVMSITQSRVCQIHSKAMLTLKNKLESYING